MSNGGHGIQLSISHDATITENTIVDNAGTGIDRKDASTTISGNNVQENDQHGISFVGASGEVNDTSITNNGEWGIYMESTGEQGVSASDLSLASTVVSFDDAQHIALGAVSSPPRNADGMHSLDQYVKVNTTRNEGHATLRLQYRDRAAEDANVTASSLRLWRYDGEWTEVSGSSAGDPNRNVVAGTVTDPVSSLSPRETPDREKMPSSSSPVTKSRSRVGSTVQSLTSSTISKRGSMAECWITSR